MKGVEIYNERFELSSGGFHSRVSCFDDSFRLFHTDSRFGRLLRWTEGRSRSLTPFLIYIIQTDNTKNERGVDFRVFRFSIGIPFTEFLILYSVSREMWDVNNLGLIWMHRGIVKV